ncbi:hypothetical protein B0H63DRAFT_485929 [Podospora didyma]|uniref:CENP-V/GFA domain-containing protein n=1 Tax=Podospora didyma TaxID=330526 RepID=A0AAE0K5I1_9PEZI|nr:hypothetical protein B0H63DRAFT_485929 [Podospora didyma]
MAAAQPQPENGWEEEMIVEIKAQCLCKAHTFTAQIPSSALPLSASYCHCNSCRHVTGALHSVDAAWPGGTPENVEQLKRYDLFPSSVALLFCGTCSSPMFFEEHEPVQIQGKEEDKITYGVFTGVLRDPVVANVGGDDGEKEKKKLPQPLVRFKDHICIEDTKDGGAAVWLRRQTEDASAPVARRWLGRRDKSELIPPMEHWPPVAELQQKQPLAEGDGDIPIRCHCGGVDLVLRAGAARREFAAQKEKGEEELPWFVDPATFKSVGSLDGCDSCRLSAGVDIFNWTFALVKHLGYAATNTPGGDGYGFPKSSIELRAALEAEGGKRDPRLGTLAFYVSSPGVQRYFCSRCSACVIYAADDRAEMVDVAVGILDAPEGARAESAISWSLGGDIVWKQDMMDGGWREELAKTVLKEAEAWRVARGYPKFWKRAEREAREAAEKKAAEKERKD